MLLCASHKPPEAVYQGDKVQQVHPRLVGLGVGQRQEGWQLETHSVACVSSLTAKEKNVQSSAGYDKFYENNTDQKPLLIRKTKSVSAKTGYAVACFYAL